MGALSPVHWLILIAVLVVLFGAKRLPDVSRSLGRSMRIFKSEVKEMGQDGKDGQAPPPAQQPAAQSVVPQLPPAPVAALPVQPAPVAQPVPQPAPVQTQPVAPQPVPVQQQPVAQPVAQPAAQQDTQATAQADGQKAG